MKHLPYILLFLIAGGLLVCCKKNNTPSNLGLLQHRWQVTSITGEALFYRGQPADYYDFGTNDTLIEYVSGHYDTASYQLIDGGQTLDLYPVINSVSTGSPFALSVKTLTASQLILSASINQPVIHILDSLRR
jgi:hypothetical protein